MRGKLFTKILSAAISAAMLITSVPVSLSAAPAKQAKADANLLKLWYDEPASQGVNILGAGGYGTTAEDNNWQQQTLPIGNSYMGANVYGEIAEERLTFNHKTLWNGGPSATKRPDYNGGNIFTSDGKKMSDIYQEVVDAFLSGDSSASSMCDQIVGEGESGGYGVYQSWGDIYLTYGGLTGTTQTTNYERNLDLATATANVDFTANGISYHREYFISHPDNVLVMKLTAEGGTMDVNVRFPVDNGENVTASRLGKDVDYTVDAAAGTIVTAGELQDNQLKMNSMIKAEAEGGSMTAGSDGESLDINGASEIILYVSADTDYKNEYPAYRTGETDEELAASVADNVASASEKGFDAVKDSHMADYKELFDRVSLDLGQASSAKTTDALLAAYKNDSASDSEKRLLEVLLYQYGRYMTIASSRAGDLPSNLQGVWQNRVGNSGRVPWGSDFHMNVNLQMNYWPTYSANLAECGIPIIDYVNSLREPGRVTAEAYFGIKSEAGEANGFSAHTQNTPFGWTCPGWAFSWGWSPAAVPWILQNCWEYYEYTGDLEYMRENIYPMLREEAILYDQILVDSGEEIILEDGTKSTRLVSAPAYSPEHGPYTLGNAYENELIWQLYEDAATAAELLGVDAGLAANWKENQKRLAPIEIGDDGQIKEWFHETTIGSVKSFQSAHRHMSHLLALFPGDQISVENQDYVDAAVVSLNERTDNATGWGIGQRINAWARLGDGNHAHRVIKSLFKNGIYPNLWDAHPPFQIDGNFGYTSGVNEMLMQSNVGYINILPAISDEWSSGSVDGIVARGNFELGIDWTGGKATEITILSNNGGECVVQAAGIKADNVTVEDSDNHTITVAKDGEKERITFDTVKGKTYTITGFGEEEAEAERLSAPTGVAAVAEGDGVKITWSAVAGADSYNVYRKVGADFIKLNTEAVTAASYTDRGELEDAEPRYRVAAVKDGVEGIRSNVVIGDTSGLARTITISFASDKTYTGSLPNEMSATSGSDVSLPDCDAVITGYLLAGWSDGTNTYEIGESYTAPLKNVTLKAVWADRIKPNWANWTATAGSEENKGNDGPASSAIDGKEGTWWHSGYSEGKTRPTISENGANNEITIDFGKTIEADSFEYIPRSVANANGNITGYKLLYSTTDSGDNFTEIKSGTWTYDVSKKTVVFDDTISMRRIQLRATQTNNGANSYIHAAEISVYRECKDVVTPVTGVTVDSEITLKNGESKKLSASVSPADATYQDLTYRSSDAQLVKVSADGTVTAGNARIGTAEITVTAEGGETAACTVTVTPSHEVEQVNLEKERIVLRPGSSAVLTASVEPYYGTDKTIAWSADDESVASVSNGKVTAHKTGKAEITASAVNGKAASCTVWVVEDPDTPADNTELDEKVEELTGQYSDDVLEGYTEESVANYRAALAKAQALLGRTDAVEPEIADILAKLSSAAEALVRKDVIDRSKLEAAVKDAQAKANGDLSAYTDESVAHFRNALKEAEGVLNNSNAAQKEIDDALEKLKAAQLTKKEPVIEDPKTLPVKNEEIAEEILIYKVTKSDAKNGTVSVKGLTSAGKKKSSITIPATVTKNGYTFKVTAIEKKAFLNNVKLKNIVIGENVTNIGANSFEKCKKLASIRFMSKKAPKSVGKNAFKGIKKNCKVFYAKKMKASELKKLKKKMKSAGKKVSYKKK